MNQSTNTTASIDLAQLDREFKRFHQMLCERFDYTHDERDWKRDQLSLIEHIARRSLTSGAPADLLNAEELAALRRFDECAQDGEGYDVPKEMMARLAEIGVLRRRSGAYYQTTEFGMHVLAGDVHDAAAPSAELIDLLKAIRPSYGAAGSRDVDVAAQQKRIDRAIELLAAGAAAKTEQVKPVKLMDGVERFDAAFDKACGKFYGEHRRLPAPIEIFVIAQDAAAGAGSAQPRAEGDERALPPLPEPWGTMYSDSLQEKDGFTADQMRGYAIDYSRAALDQGAQAATTASASDQKPCGWLAGNSHDGGETMYCRREDAQRECDEYNTFERSHPDFDPESLRTPKPVYLAALARAPLPAQSVQPVDEARDTLEQLLIEKRIAIIPENDGGFHAHVYGDSDEPKAKGYGRTPREAIDAAMRANDSAAEGGDA